MKFYILKDDKYLSMSKEAIIYIFLIIMKMKHFVLAMKDKHLIQHMIMVQMW